MDIYIKYYYIYTETGTCISSHICIQLARMIIDRLKTEMELKTKTMKKKKGKKTETKLNMVSDHSWTQDTKTINKNKEDEIK